MRPSLHPRGAGAGRGLPGQHCQLRQRLEMVGGSVDTGEVVGWERRRCGNRSRTRQFEWLPKECKITGLQPRKGAADVQVPL